MIKIINGTYGYRNPDTNQIEAKTARSKPFSLSPDREKELVREGVAEYVKSSRNAIEDKGEGMAEPDSMEKIKEIPKYNARSTVEELTTIAEQLGIRVEEGMKKKDLTEAIDKKMMEDEPVEGAEETDDEPAPETLAFMPE